MNPSTYKSSNFVTFDLETTNIDKGSAQSDNLLVLSCWANADSTINYKWGGVHHASELVTDLEEADFCVGHNIKFDLKWMRNAGIDLSKIVVWDTLIAEYVFAGNRNVDLSLGATAERYGFSGKEPFIDKQIRNGVCPSELPESLLLRRCVYDVDVTRKIFYKQYQRAVREGKLGVIFTRCLITPVLADIEFSGINLDAAKVLDAHSAALTEFNEVSRQLAAFGNINWNSPKQKAQLLYEELGFKELVNYGKPIRTAKDSPITDLATISKLKATNKKQREFKELIHRHSKLDAQLSKALTKFVDCIRDNDYLFAVFNQTVTKTHRLSSSGTKHKVQFQNLARIFKPLITARTDGWLICEADGAQLEFRVAAFLGQDQQAIQDIRDGVDVHAFTSQTITEAGQPTDRQDAKSHTFKPLYGGESGTDAEQAYYAAFKQKYSGIASTQEEWKRQAINTKKLRIASGLEYFFPACKMQRSGFVTNQNEICNYPVQSLATADIIPIALYYLWKGMKEQGLQSFIINTVHDSVIMEVHPDEVQQIRELCIDAFTYKVYEYLKEVYNLDFNCPLGIGIKFGTHWGVGKEEKLNVEPS